MRLLGYVDAMNTQVSFQWKNPDYLLKNPDFLLNNPHFLLKTVNFMIKHTVVPVSYRVLLSPACGYRWCCELQYKCQLSVELSIENAEIMWNCP